MEFGLLTLPRHPDAFIEEARAVERSGFDFLGVPDSQCLLRELYTSLGAAALTTETIALGPSVTNPITRHPAVTASAICTLDEHADGRAVLGIATGDSAVYTLDKSPATVRDLQTAIETITRLCRGERVEYAGEDIRLTWRHHQTDPGSVPVMVAAEGPRTLRMAGRVADRVLIGLGLTPPVLEHAIDYVHTGARDADRDPDAIEKWVYARAAITDDIATVEGALEDAVAASAHHALQFSLEGKRVPKKHEAAVRELVREYESDQHVGLGDTPVNRRLMNRLGLTEYLTERFAIAGPPATWLDRIEAIEAAGAIDGVHLHPVHDDPIEFIHRMRDTVFPTV